MIIESTPWIIKNYVVNIVLFGGKHIRSRVFSQLTISFMIEWSEIRYNA